MVVTVSPFSGECDICPSCEGESYYQVYLAAQTMNISHGNMFRGIGALLPHSWTEIEKIFHQGYSDAVSFLKREGENETCINTVYTLLAFARYNFL